MGEVIEEQVQQNDCNVTVKMEPGDCYESSSCSLPKIKPDISALTLHQKQDNPSEICCVVMQPVPLETDASTEFYQSKRQNEYSRFSNKKNIAIRNSVRTHVHGVIQNKNTAVSENKIIHNRSVLCKQSKKLLKSKTSEDQDIKKLQCDVCQKAFKTASHLTRHMRVHTGERPFKCDLCEKGFKDSCDLKRHQRIHTRERPFICNVCEKCFIQSKDLKSHERVHSGDRPFKCKQCNKKFSTSSYLTVHARTHSGDRPFTCDLCDKSFAGSNTLLRHKRTHSGEKPFKCNICNKAFTRLGSLKRHQKSHNNMQ